MDDGEHERPRPHSYRARSGCAEALLWEAVQKLRSAAAMVDLIIDDELAGSRDAGTLDRLHAAKGEVARAIDEAMMHLSMSGTAR